jgi:adenosine deaminase
MDSSLSARPAAQALCRKRPDTSWAVRAAVNMRESQETEGAVNRRAFQGSIFEVATEPDALIKLVRTLPKIELHAHLSGCLRFETVRELVIGRQLEVSPAVLSDLYGAVTFQVPAPNYASLFRPWRLVLNRVTELTDVAARLLLEVAEDFSRDGVIYAELRVSPRLPLRNGDLREYLAEMHQARKEALERFKIDIRLILGFTRHAIFNLPVDDKLEFVRRVLAAAQPYANSTVIGFDLWGNEHGFASPKAFRQVFEEVRAQGYRVTVHAGEVGNAAGIAESIELLGAERIGHGTRAVDSPEIMRQIISSNVAIETCLSSNRLTGAWPTVATHPLATFLANGVPATVCTDNTLVFGTTLSEELALGLRSGLLSGDTLRLVMLNAANHAFADSETRERLDLAVLTEYSPQALEAVMSQLARVG